MDREEGEGGWLLELKCFACVFGRVSLGIQRNWLWVLVVYIYIDTIDIGEVVSLEDDVRLLRVSGEG